MNGLCILNGHKRTPAVYINAEFCNRRLGIRQETFLKGRIKPRARYNLRPDSWRAGIHVFDRLSDLISRQHAFFYEQRLYGLNSLFIIRQFVFFSRRSMGLVFVHRSFVLCWL